ncbi:unnamed protein product, partial [Staurois parvus]
NKKRPKILKKKKHIFLCFCYKRDDQRLQTVQGMTRDCGHSTGDDQRLRTQYRG